MGAVFEQFAEELKAWEAKFAGRPRDELIGLCLMALEREELVSVGYREELMTQRLSAMPIPPAVRHLMRHALIWAWRDEEMHSIYIRGALLKYGGPILRMKAFAQQLGGLVGGWAGSVRQHVPWSKAPVSRAGATFVTWLGALTGKVPEDVRKYLNYGPFREFCVFNIDAEKTASLCYERMIALALEAPELGRELAQDFVKVRDDEDRHARIFEILANALNEKDQLVDGETEESLTRKIEDVGEYFLPRTLRKQTVVNSKVGSGGRVFALEGKTAEEKCGVFRRLLEESGLEAKLRQRAVALGKGPEELRIVINDKLETLASCGSRLLRRAQVLGPCGGTSFDPSASRAVHRLCGSAVTLPLGPAGLDPVEFLHRTSYESGRGTCLLVAGRVGKI